MPQGELAGASELCGVHRSTRFRRLSYVGYGYDTVGRLATLTTPSGGEIAHSYTSGRVTGVTVNGHSLLEGITYEPFGPTRGWEWGNGATTVRD